MDKESKSLTVQLIPKRKSSFAAAILEIIKKQWGRKEQYSLKVKINAC